MKDIENFIKLYKISVPVEQHFDHYVEANINAGDDKLQPYIDLYNEREALVKDMYVDKTNFFKIVQEALENTMAFKNFEGLDRQELSLANEDAYPPAHGGIKHATNEDTVFVSIDLVTANFQTLKHFDLTNELGQTWEEFLTKLNIPELYIKSKGFRQYIFGQINPKKTNLFQHDIMCKTVRLIWSNTMNYFIENRLVFRSPDELIFALPRGMFNFNENLDFLLNIEKHYNRKHERQKRFRVTLFTNELIDNKAMCRTILDKDLNPVKKVLKNVEGNVYYMYLRKYILKEEILDIDKTFTLEGRVAKWEKF